MHLIVKPLYQCNLRCLYCNETPRHDVGARMSIGDVRTMVRHLRDHYAARPADESVQIFWQGGEPFLMGPEFYAEALDIQRAAWGDRRPWWNAIQTNLTLLDDRWMALLGKERERLSLGISFDFFGDDRRWPDGRSSRETVLANIHRLMEAGFPPSIVCVLTRSNTGRLESIYDFIHRYPVSVRFNQLVNAPGGRRRGCGGATRLTNAEYTRALRWLNRRWLEDGAAAGVVANTREMLRQIRFGVSNCYYSEDCQTWHLTVAPDGTAYPCVNLDGDEYRLGNILTDPLDQILNSPVRQAWHERPRRIREGACRGCDVLELCRGGCPNHTVAYGRDLYGRDPFCTVHRNLFRQLRGILRRAGYS